MPYAIIAVVVLIGLGLILWQAFAPGPRRRRAFGRAQKLLDAGSWKEALALVEAQQPARLPEPWKGRLRGAAGECHQQAGEATLKEKRYEEALEHFLTAAPLLGQDEDDQRTRVLEHALTEVRRLFATGTRPADIEAVLALVQRTFALSGGVPSPEALFWQGLCHVRQGDVEPAIATLTAAHDLVGKQVLDPAFYLGVLHHQLDRPQEALRFLAEANRVDGSCPFVTWQMGISLVAAGGDSGLALRALQRALGPRGLPLWLAHPERAWVEGLPENRSYARRLALKHHFVCPLLGDDLAAIVRQGQLALAQAQYRQERFAESAELFGKLLQESAPTVPQLRGYGLALARLKQYDQAYKHLRAALEQEDPKDPFTAGYLALCGALGRPTQSGDKPKNVAWAIRLMARYPLTGNGEWAGLLSAVFAEARELGMSLGADEQLLLCDTQASVQATDAPAAAGYANLAATHPDAVRPMYAWLYARAASAGGFTAPGDLALFALAFRDPAGARDYFAQQEWDFDEAEYTYLARSSAQAPGRFPEALGADYPTRGEAFLLDWSRKHEEAGRKDAACEAVEVLLRLAPASLSGHDRLACLHYRRGEAEQAVALLKGWQRLAPADPWPLIRQAVIEQERGNAERRAEAIDRALGLTRGPQRAAVAFLGARLALREAARTWQPDPKTLAGHRPEPGVNGEAHPPGLAYSVALLHECLREDPEHVQALWCLAAVRAVQGDRKALAEQAPRMNQPSVTDGRFHLLGAVCHLAAGDYRRVLELGDRATAADEALAVESQYVMGWAHLHLRDGEAARRAFQKVAAAERSPSVPYARALLGHLHYARGACDDAVHWWGSVDVARRAEWRLDEPLRQAVLLAGLLALENEKFEQAAERFREAGKLGLRDRRLARLLTLSLVKAGQRLLFSSDGG
jgi:tetratricopeptide (TPR) repeat protein